MPKPCEKSTWASVGLFRASMFAGLMPGARMALRPLLEHRKAQATRKHAHYYKEYAGADGYRPNETKLKFLARMGAGPGPADGSPGTDGPPPQLENEQPPASLRLAGEG